MSILNKAYWKAYNLLHRNATYRETVEYYPYPKVLTYGKITRAGASNQYQYLVDTDAWHVALLYYGYPNGVGHLTSWTVLMW